jgi:hypothetical protein
MTPSEANRLSRITSELFSPKFDGSRARNVNASTATHRRRVVTRIASATAADDAR